MAPGHASELDIGHWEQLLSAFQSVGKVRVLVSNSSVTCEVVGTFGGFSTWGEFFNVQSATLDLHLRPAQFAAAFAVEKPSHMNGSATLSFQFFDREGAAVMKVFLNFGEEASAECLAAFQHFARAVLQKITLAAPLRLSYSNSLANLPLLRNIAYFSLLPLFPS